MRCHNCKKRINPSSDTTADDSQLCNPCKKRKYPKRQLQPSDDVAATTSSAHAGETRTVGDTQTPTPSERSRAFDSNEFRTWGKQMVDYIADYMETVGDRPTLSKVQPGYLSQLIPREAPIEAEKCEDVFADIERVIMPGVTHWHSPNFHAFYPAGNSFPSIMGDMLSDAIGCIGFSWAASPACTELEVVMLDWFARLKNLPNKFIVSEGGKGGGSIQGSASESILITLLAARTKTIREVKAKNPEMDEYAIMSKLVSYTSDQANSAFEKAGMIGLVKMRQLETDEKYALRGSVLKEAIEKDKANGLIPFYVCATLGTTNGCAFDNLMEVGPICNEEDVWLHVDAAYAGSAFICPEFRHLLDGVEFSQSYNFNLHKWLRVCFDCSLLWLHDRTDIVDAFNVNPLFLCHDNQEKVTDFRHWQISLGRRFRSLKVWFVVRLFGVKQLQDTIKQQVQLAHDFETMVNQDDRFEVSAEVVMAMVCFRLKGSDARNEKLLQMTNTMSNIYIGPSRMRDKYILRFIICTPATTTQHITDAWKVIQDFATQILADDA
ncbi:aromatic-L-amino-acid decarboxylase-like [Glandiceps talaboti]